MTRLIDILLNRNNRTKLLFTHCLIEIIENVIPIISTISLKKMGWVVLSLPLHETL